MGKVTGLAHIGVKVSDIERSKAFYMDTLGFRLDEENDLGATKLAFISNGNCLIELIATDHYHAPEGFPAVDHICMEVVCIDELVETLKKKGIEFDTGVNYAQMIRGGVKNIFFKGPDGERIEFFDYMK